MVAFMVASFYASVRAERQPSWGLRRAALRVARVLHEGVVDVLRRRTRPRRDGHASSTRGNAGGGGPTRGRRPRARRPSLTLGGLAACGVLALAVFVLPNWEEYRFYNWQMSVTRKPDLHSCGRCWTARAGSRWCTTSSRGCGSRWSSAPCAALGRGAPAPHEPRGTPAAGVAVAGVAAARPARRRQRAPVRVPDSRLRRLDGPGDRPRRAPAAGLAGRRSPAPGGWRCRWCWARPTSSLARSSACCSSTRSVPACGGRHWPRVLLTALAFYRVAGRRWRGCCRAHRLGTTAALAVTGLVMAGDLAQFAQFARGRTYKNVEAMRLVAERIPPGTLVHGKLANGLALESRIRPVFVGNRFGNYEDRFRRDDARLILTYVSPRIGYEGPIIVEVLDAYPRQAATLDRPGGRDHRRGRPRGAVREGLARPTPPIPAVRTIDDAAIKAHAERRFRSEYDYALFEYWRSAKVFALLDRAGVTVGGRVLDAGCGGGGMPLSLAEETSSVVAIDLVDRFKGAGTRLAHGTLPREPAVRAGRRPGPAVPRRGLRRRALARRHRARGRRAALPARVPARAEARRVDVPLHRAVPLVCRRAPAAAEGARSPAPAVRPAHRVQHVRAAREARAVGRSASPSTRTRSSSSRGRTG